MELIVKYKYGKIPFIYHNASAPMVRQVIEQINPELVKACGSYIWHLDGDTYDGYQIVATWQGYKWIDSTGKSPSEVLYNFLPARNILSQIYGINKGR